MKKLVILLVFVSILALFLSQSYRGRFIESITEGLPRGAIEKIGGIPSFDLKNLGQNLISENFFAKQLDGTSFALDGFTIFVKTKGNYLTLHARNEEKNQYFDYLIQNPGGDKYFTLVDSEGNVKNFNLIELAKKSEKETVNKIPIQKLRKEYKDKIESILLDETYLKREGYKTKEDNIPVIISLNTEPFLEEKAEPLSKIGLSILEIIKKILAFLRLEPPSTEVQPLTISPKIEKEEERVPREAFDRAKSEVISILEKRPTGLTEAQWLETRSKVKRDLRIIDALSVEVSREKLDDLKSSPYVKKISLDRRVHILLDESVPLINATQLWQVKDGLGRNITGQDVTIAIIDTGIDYTHPDFGSCTESEFLDGNCNRVIGGYDFYNSDNNPMDDHGHGTHCAGIAAANGRLKGVAPDAKLYAYKVLSSGGSGSFSSVIAGIERSVDPNNDGDYSDHVDVMSMSLGGSGDPDDEMSQAVDTAVKNGVVVVIAAGNSGPYSETIGSPGCARKALTVGAMCKPSQVGIEGYCNEIIASFSSRGPTSIGGIKPDVVAPGVKICSSQWDDAWQDYQCVDDEHTAISGTSMATPHVAGAAALLIQAHPDWESEEVKSALMSTAEDLWYDVETSTVYDVNTQGTGKIDSYRAYSAVLATNPQSISFGHVDTDDFSGEFIIKNLESYPIYLNLNTSLVKDNKGNYYSFASLNASSITIEANSKVSVLLIVNVTANAEGVFEGKVIINDTYKIPFSFIKLSKLTISVKGDNPLYPNIYLHDDNISYTASAGQGWDFEGDTATFFVPSGNYSVYAVSDFDEAPLEYMLMDRVEVPISSEVNKTMRLSDARPFTVKARALDGTELKLYEWQKGFSTYNDERVFSVNFHDPAYGDRIVYVSNKPDSPLDTDVVFKYYGVPEK